MANQIVYRLVDGHMEPDVNLDPTLVPSSDEKAALAGTEGTPGSGNAYVTDTDPRIPTTAEKAALAGVSGYTPNADDPYATKDYVSAVINALDWQESILHGIDYVKTDTGAPTGSPSSGEKCLNTADATLYEESGGAWDAGSAVSANDRFCHKDTGSDTSGDSGTHTASNNIYEYDGSSFTTITPDNGFACLFEDESARYQYNGSTWVKFDSLASHNTLSGLQGGTTDEYYHITSDQEAALDAADSPSSSNKVLVQTNAADLPTVCTFTRDGGMGQSQTDLTAYLQGKRTTAVMFKAGYIVGAVLQTSSTCSGGQLDSKIQKNGTDLTPTDLDLTLDSTTNPDKNYASVAYGTTNFDFSAGDELSVDFDTDASWATSSGNEAVTQEVHVAYV